MNTRTRWLVIDWMLVIAWMFLIFAGSTDLLSANHTSRFLVPFLLWRAVRHHWSVGKSFWKPATLTLVVAMIYATTDEFHQSFIPSRTATAHDVMIDIIGAMIGIVICWVFVRNRRATNARAI